MSLELEFSLLYRHFKLSFLKDERLKGVDKKLAKMIMNEIMDKGLSISWNDIAG